MATATEFAVSYYDHATPGVYPWWRNFIVGWNTRAATMTYQEYLVMHRLKVLDTHQSQGKPCMVAFESEEDFIMFLLKFS